MSGQPTFGGLFADPIRTPAFTGEMRQALLTAALLERSIRYALERKRAEEALRRARDELEARVAERCIEQLMQDRASAAKALLSRKAQAATDDAAGQAAHAAGRK